MSRLLAYLHEEEGERPAVIIVPGGGYAMVAIGEGELVAKRFYELGYQAFVLTYTTTCFSPEPLGLQPLRDLSRAVSCVAKGAADYGVSPGKISLCGFSAGANLCANLAVHAGEEVLLADGGSDGSNRPGAVMLCYPVISDEEDLIHRDSFTALCGQESTKADWDYFSAEKHVSEKTPLVFLWHTAEDELVPAANSLRMAEACRRCGVPFELHIFPRGPHGLSVATEEWARGEYGADYPMDQFFAKMQYCIDRELPPPAPFDALHLPKGTDYREVFRSMPKDYLKTEPNPHAAVWPELADRWLQDVFQEAEK